MIYSALSYDDHEQVVFCRDPHTGLKAIIAIHRAGPKGRALGGCRMVDYKDEDAALDDVLRLSKGMTYKSAVSGLTLGGGKCVIIGDPANNTPELMRSLGRFVDGLGGRYITSVDVGISGSDIAVMQGVTKFAVGAGSADPSPMTSLGVFKGIQASVKYKLGREDLSGLKVAILGIGKVGYGLAEHLSNEGASLIVADVNNQAVDKAVGELGATASNIDSIWDEEVDVFSPCALGGAINQDTLPRLKTSIVAGGANNQLREDSLAKAVRDQGILYAPDYVINAGGLIMVDSEVEPYSMEEVKTRTLAIYGTLMQIFQKADAQGTTTLQAAEELAKERYAAGELQAAE